MWPEPSSGGPQSPHRVLVARLSCRGWKLTNAVYYKPPTLLNVLSAPSNDGPSARGNLVSNGFLANTVIGSLHSTFGERNSAPQQSTYVMRCREQSQNSISMARSCLDSSVSLLRHSKKSFSPPWGPSSQINAHSLGSRSSR